MIARVAALVAAGALIQGQTPFHVETRLVVLQASVKDARGALVTGLPPAAFTIFENGARQPIALFRSDDVPVSLGLLIDNSGSMRTKRPRLEAAALDFARASNPDDEIFVLNFADRSHIDVPFTSDVHVLEAGIARLDSIGGTAIRDAIAAGEDYLVPHARHDRRALIVLTDGNDNASLTPFDQIRASAEQYGVSVYAVELLGSGDSRGGRSHGELEELARATGGVAVFPSTVEQIAAVAQEIARQIRSQYTIGYAPLNQALDGSYRTIRVTAVAAGQHLSVQTRKGYRAVASLVPRPETVQP